MSVRLRVALARAAVMLDVLLPRTDAGALTQIAVVLPALALVTFLLRRHREWRTLSLGVLFVVAGFFALRMVH